MDNVPSRDVNGNRREDVLNIFQPSEAKFQTQTSQNVTSSLPTQIKSVPFSFKRTALNQNFNRYENWYENWYENFTLWLELILCQPIHSLLGSVGPIKFCKSRTTSVHTGPTKF